MIDDITFTPSGSYRPLDLKGYDVYRDGVKLNEQPVTEGSYLDTDVPVGKHTYHVVAVYGEGNSELSAPVKLETSSLTGVEASGVKVTGLHGAIRVSAPADATVNVYSTDGCEIYKGVGSGLIHTTAAVYLVKVNRAVYKTIVK